jgi:transcriptional regulator with XRE-family HTH domain
MLTRIQRIMDEKGLSVSTLADEIGVKRPTMTHTMTGRNNPSLDIVSKILERYKEISSDWLLFGVGAMNKPNTPIQQGLFDQVSDSPLVAKSEEAPVYQTQREAPLKNMTAIAIDSENRTDKQKEAERKVSKILIFFSDSTFETFIPETTPKK